MAEYLAFDSGQWEDSKNVAFKNGQKYEFCLLESTKNMNIHPWALLRPVAWQEDTGELCEEECNDCCYQHDGHEGEEGRGEGEAEARHEGDEVCWGGAALLLLQLLQPGVVVAQLVAGLVLAVAGEWRLVLQKVPSEGS